MRKNQAVCLSDSLSGYQTDSDQLSDCVGRLVVVDVAFYTENVLALKSLEQLDLNMAEVWEQKR